MKRAGVIVCGCLMLMVFGSAMAAKNGLVKEYYPDGTIKAETMYKDGVKQGEAKRYTENGVLNTTYIYKDGDVVKVIPADTMSKIGRGKLSFLRDFRFWGVLFLMIGVLWVLFVKLLLKNKF